MNVFKLIDKWGQKNFKGHKKVGAVRICGWNAMQCAIVVSTRWGYVSFRLPMYIYGKWRKWYLYVSPNATPWASTIMLGPRFTKREKAEARWRRQLFGVKYNTDVLFYVDENGERHSNDALYDGVVV